jgi:hypothetical protein
MNIRRIDLIERRVFCATGVTAVLTPLAAHGTVLCNRYRCAGPTTPQAREYNVS